MSLTWHQALAWRLRMQLLEPVRVGNLTATKQKVLFAVPSDDSINVGSDFLKDYVLTLDQRHHLLRIARP